MGGTVENGSGNMNMKYQQSCMHHYNSREVSQYSHRGGILQVFSEVEFHVSWMSS